MAEGEMMNTAADPGNPAATNNDQELHAKIIDAIRTGYDPEIPVNIYELGLIYDLQVETDGIVKIQMTLTAPSCPEAGSIPPRVESAVSAVPGVSGVAVDLVWEPQWNPDRMSDAAKLQLGML